MDHEWIYPYYERWVRVTTPIAYMTSIPADPFADEEVIRNFPWPNNNPYPLTSGEYPPVLAYAHALRINASGGYDILFNIIFQQNSMEWLMRGIGPDRNPMWLGGGEPGYDPSNGVVSRGQIHWFGPGGGEIAPVRFNH